MAAWRYEISLLVLKKYLSRSLRSLVKYFSTLEEKFRISARPCNILYISSLRNLERFYVGEKFQLLARKGVFPYDWFDSFSKLSVTQLPPKEAFHSKLKDEDIQEKDYQHAQKVWETLEMKIFRDYHNLYILRQTYSCWLMYLRVLDMFVGRIIN